MGAPAGKTRFCGADPVRRLRLDVSGAVQGVGFRPFVFRLAGEEGLGGAVRNTRAGARVEIEGPDRAVENFLTRLRTELPPPGRVDDIRSTVLAARGGRGFKVIESDGRGGGGAVVLPDLAPCPDCLRDLRDPNDRRHGYAFTTCAQCGPRYSVISALPYDRERTSMRQFPLCPECAKEYADPASRRFHAETISCPDCGPRLALWDETGAALAEGAAALVGAIEAIRGGRIVALKGLGGFQLLCDAGNEEAVLRLRARKKRPAKPLALMVGDLDAAKALAEISQVEQESLVSAARPIVLLKKRAGTQAIAASVAPDNPLLGIMLPATPLHVLLCDALGFALVATSGNLSGGVLVTDEADAVDELGGIAEMFLLHDRHIVRPVDDSVVRVIAGEPVTLRAARGLAPVRVDAKAAGIVAFGGHQKASVAIGTDSGLVLGPHIGDLDTAVTRRALRHASEALPALYGVKPATIASDRHPDYFSTRLAAESGGAVRQVPHHLAHVLACRAEHGISGPVLGLAFDGSGYGDDGTIWGGEFLAVGEDSWRRVGHLLAFGLPGGEAAVREPRRSALGALCAVLGKAAVDSVDIPAIAAFSANELQVLNQALAKGVNAPATSSAGRLFDVVAAVLGLRQGPCFEGEAAMAVEFAAMGATHAAALDALTIGEANGRLVVDWRPTLLSLIAAQTDGVDPAALALGFHDALADASVAMARMAGIEQVVLTGGCFQNAVLTELALDRLTNAGFHVYRHNQVPPNDGGLAVGQAVYAAHPLTEEQG